MTVKGYLSDKLSLPLSELTKDNVATELEKYGAGEDLISTFNDILSRCEFAQYAPAQSNRNYGGVIFTNSRCYKQNRKIQ